MTLLVNKGLPEWVKDLRVSDPRTFYGACDVVYPSGWVFRGKLNETMRRKPHYYFQAGSWWCARLGRVSEVTYDL